jgi:fatty acid desaturase
MAGSNAIYATARAEERNVLVRLTARSDLKGLVQLACHLCALLATGALVWSARSTPWLLPALLLHGVVLVFLFAPLHEGVHWTAFRSRRLNDAVAWLCGACHQSISRLGRQGLSLRPARPDHPGARAKSCVGKRKLNAPDTEHGPGVAI